MLLSVLLLLLVSGTQANHYSGTVITYYPKETFTNGSVDVILRYKLNYDVFRDGSYSCTQNCGVESLILSNTKIEEVIGSWCQSEKMTSRLLPNNSPFQLNFSSGNWLGNKNSIGPWIAVSDVELRTRNDTNKPNTSPQTTILPALRVPSNCPININLLAFDPDGDIVKCSYPNHPKECASPCTHPPVLYLHSFLLKNVLGNDAENCTLSFGATSSSNEGYYAVQMVMQDFPRQTITLTQTNGSQVVKTTKDAISKIPIQFAFRVHPTVTSCTKGHYLPRFLSPEHRTQFHSPVNQTLEIKITAEANLSTISGLLFSGPHNVVKESLVSGNFKLTWTPSESEAGQSHPICFVVEARVSNSTYQSELRCVIVTVGDVMEELLVTSTAAVPTLIPLTSADPPPRTSHLTVLKVKISTTLPLNDNRDIIAEGIRKELIRRGLPPHIQVRLLNNGSVEVKNTAPLSG